MIIKQWIWLFYGDGSAHNRSTSGKDNKILTRKRFWYVITLLFLILFSGTILMWTWTEHPFSVYAQLWRHTPWPSNRVYRPEADQQTVTSSQIRRMDVGPAPSGAGPTSIRRLLSAATALLSPGVSFLLLFPRVGAESNKCWSDIQSCRAVFAPAFVQRLRSRCRILWDTRVMSRVHISVHAPLYKLYVHSMYRCTVLSFSRWMPSNYMYYLSCAVGVQLHIYFTQYPNIYFTFWVDMLLTLPTTHAMAMLLVLTFTVRGSTLDVRIWRLKSIPAL